MTIDNQINSDGSSEFGAGDGDAALYFPADHPAVKEGRPAGGNMHVDIKAKTVTFLVGGWLEGPVRVGAGWTLLHGDNELLKGPCEIARGSIIRGAGLEREKPPTEVDG